MRPLKNAYQEAYRYIDNAKELLKEKAGRENGFYRDEKYVRMAGDTAWKGVLIAVEHWLKKKGIERVKGMRPDVEWYSLGISKFNRKLNTHFVTAYNILHKSMGYDGILSSAVVNEGMKEAYNIIARCEKDS